ncbi:hypothetical protein OAC57_10560 [Planktomarina temperata]|nr:hypothetical protein [Planktomarina temperata]
MAAFQYFEGLARFKAINSLNSGGVVPLTAIPSDIVMALLGRTVTKSINENTRARLIMAWLSGLLLMAIAVNLHLQFI